MTALLELIALAIISEVPLPGTQPNELLTPPEPSTTCSCHDSFDTSQITEPGESYKATMMALSARDPLFRAALQISFEDRPDLSDLCIRCHVPVAWLNGRSEPADGSLIQVEDREGITCDICHRAVRPTPQLIGDGQLTLSQEITKRAPRGVMPPGGHQVEADPYVASSDLCGVCHSLFNPAEDSHDGTAANLGYDYYEQRTYEEWVDSTYPADDKTCISCHMSRATGAAVRDGGTYQDLAVHNFVGGNHFGVQAVKLLNPNIGIANLTDQVTTWIDQGMKKAAEIAITQPLDAVMVEGGDDFSFKVRLTNKTGHKLPTGYPEGRRVYLEVQLLLDGRAPQVLSGQWDQPTGMLVEDPQLRTYETKHGRVEDGVSTRIHHLILMNQVITDTRIPPEGFFPSYADMLPQGRDYGGGPPYRHWDDHTYTFSAPEVTGTLTGTIAVRAMYQSTDGEVVSFLLEESTGREHDELAMVWGALNHAPPREVVRTSIPIMIRQKVVAVDGGMTGGGDDGAGGCSCVTALPVKSDLAPLWILVGLMALGLHRRKGRSTHHGIQTSRTPLLEGRTVPPHLG